MAVLNREARAVQNSAFGAMLLWRCCSGYHTAHKSASPMPIPLLFIVPPILRHEETANMLIGTQQRSGLRKFIEKFHIASTSKTDLVLAISPRARAMSPLTLSSLRIAIASNLLALDVSVAGVFPLSKTQPALGIPGSVRPLLAAAEKLGAWFAQISLYEIELLLETSI